MGYRLKEHTHSGAYIHFPNQISRGESQIHPNRLRVQLRSNTSPFVPLLLLAQSLSPKGITGSDIRNWKY